MKSRLTRLIGSSLFLVLALTGCLGDGKSLGLGRRPYLPYVATLTFSEAEATQLKQCAANCPDLFQKLQIHNNTQAAIAATYMKEAIKVNLEQLKALQYSDDEAKSMVYSGLRRMGYPADHQLLKDYAPPPEKVAVTE